MVYTIKIRFTNNRRPSPENLGMIPCCIEPISIPEGLYKMDREFSSLFHLYDYLECINLQPCVQLAWLQQ